METCFSTAVRLDPDAGAHAYQIQVRSSQVDQVANKIDDSADQGVENAGRPSHARRHGAA